MPFKIEDIGHEKGVIISWTGVAVAADVIRSSHERYKPVERLKTLRYIITDYTDMEKFFYGAERYQNHPRNSQTHNGSNNG